MWHKTETVDNNVAKFHQIAFPSGNTNLLQSINEDMLESYLYTEANITTYKLVKSHLNADTRLPAGFTELDLAITMDSILALYHGVKLNFHGKHTCRWTGRSRIHRVLSKVSKKNTQSHRGHKQLL